MVINMETDWIENIDEELSIIADSGNPITDAQFDAILELIIRENKNGYIDGIKHMDEVRIGEKNE
jgi:hypothetical protein